ncbi:MAG TPA: sialate O-acetylesterase, partial [Opitutales bacterium]|nr:sialate O-acetylesterase [Opitutales bacterium]
MPIMTPLAAASLALSPLFCDHMVLQQGMHNPIWGNDGPGEHVTVTVEGDNTRVSVDTVANENGVWMAKLPELPAGGPYTITVDGSGEEKITDVLVGEVWLVSGQSNMEFTVKQADGAEAAIAAANNPQIRHFKVAQNAQPKAVGEVPGSWEVESPASLGDFSAIGYFFARELNANLDVPIGIINSTWGGTCVEAWTSLD